MNVDLIRENGEVVHSVTDRTGMVRRAADALDGASRLLQYVDEYGDTYFNKLQMPDLTSDWRAARATVRTPDDARFWQDVADLLRQCAESTHLYLKLVGE